MKPLSFKIAVLLLLAPVTASAAIESGPFINPANNHTYYLLTAGTWTKAEAEAVTLGGHLVTINDSAEQQWVYSTFGGHEIWIGLTDREIEGTFQWVSGETPAYRNWAPGEPNNAASGNNNQDYIHIYSNKFTPASVRGQWDDRSETETLAAGFQGVVEIPDGIPSQITILPAFELAWPTQTNLKYQIEWSSSLAPGDWFSLGDPIQGSGSTYYHLISPRSAERRFYRVRVLTP